MSNYSFSSRFELKHLPQKYPPINPKKQPFLTHLFECCLSHVCILFVKWGCFTKKTQTKYGVGLKRWGWEGWLLW